MSRGAGRIERAIRELFDAHPDLAFVTDELAEHCYPSITQIERKHQVSVLRAAHKVVAPDPDWRALTMYRWGGGSVFVNMANVKSYALGKLICMEYYPEKRARRWCRNWRMGEDVCQILTVDREKLLYRLESDYCRKLMTPLDEHWARDVQEHCTRRDTFTVAIPPEMAKRQTDEMLAALAEALTGPEARIRRGLSVASTPRVQQATLNPGIAVTMAERIRGLTTENDPDVLRASLADIATELDAWREVAQ